MSATPDWNEFQANFLTVLTSESEAAAIVDALLQTSLSSDQRAWIEAMRPDMLETAAVLVKKWGDRDGQS